MFALPSSSSCSPPLPPLPPLLLLSPCRCPSPPRRETSLSLPLCLPRDTRPELQCTSLLGAEPETATTATATATARKWGRKGKMRLPVLR